MDFDINASDLRSVAACQLSQAEKDAIHRLRGDTPTSPDCVPVASAIKVRPVRGASAGVGARDQGFGGGAVGDGAMGGSALRARRTGDDDAGAVACDAVLLAQESAPRQCCGTVGIARTVAPRTAGATAWEEMQT
jgi:hypothetical protein